MRRLRTSASGSFSTLCSHSRELIFDAQAAGIRALGRLRVTGVLIFYAQVAEIYSGLSLHTMIHNQGGVLSLRRLRRYAATGAYWRPWVYFVTSRICL